MLFFNALFIGLCIAAPVGPIGMLCIQRSLARGFRSGFATGLGAACADGLYGLLGALGVAGMVGAFPRAGIALQIAGGLFLGWLAWTTARGGADAPHAETRGEARGDSRREFVSTFLLTLSNPMTILSFVAVFASLGGGGMHSALGATAAMVSGVFAGSALWWLGLAGFTAALRGKLPARAIRAVSIVSALAIAAFGAVQIVRGVWRLATLY